MKDLFIYEQGQYFAQIAEGLEELGADELTKLGAQRVFPVYRGIEFEADKATLYRINYSTRLITRILAPLITFGCNNPDSLYRNAKTIRWEQFMTIQHTFAIFSNVSNSDITHSQYASRVLKDAIADYFRDNFGKRPNVERDNPDAWFSLYIDRNQAIISYDTSHGSLHRRGYRKQAVEAPIQETVAAAIISMIEWDDSKKSLYDPMCGSGTLLCESLMYLCNIPSGYCRQRFGFDLLPDYDPLLFKSIKAKCDSDITQSSITIAGSDISKESVHMAKNNINALPYGNEVSLTVTDINLIPNISNSIILCNPPYGIRMKFDSSIEEFYKKLGDFFKQRCKGSTAYVYFGNRELIKSIGLKASWKKPLLSGGLDGRLVKYDLY